MILSKMLHKFGKKAPYAVFPAVELPDVQSSGSPVITNPGTTGNDGRNRNAPIDFLRCCGVLLVMINHLPFTGVQSTIGKMIWILLTGGWVGVDLFFVISGYLVGGLVIKEYNLKGSFNLSRFLVRRGLKIYPAYYLFVFFELFYTSVNHNLLPQTTTGLWHELFFVANYGKNNNPHLWSISVEEHFYLLLALLFSSLIYFRKVNLKMITTIYIGLAITCLSFRIYNYYSYSFYKFTRDYTPSHLRFDALFFGVLLAYLAACNPEKLQWVFKKGISRFVGVFCILFLFTNFMFEKETNRWVSVVNLTLNPICFGYILVRAAAIKNETVLKLISPFAYIGRYSYSIYLFHLCFREVAGMLFSRNLPLFLLGYIGFAIAGGIVLSKLVEYPVLRLRDKWFPSGTSAS